MNFSLNNLSKWATSFFLFAQVTFAQHQDTLTLTSFNSSLPAVRGLEGVVSLDAWANSFAGPQSAEVLSSKSAQNLLQNFIQQRDAELNSEELYQFIVKTFGGKPKDAFSLEAVATALFKVRETMRKKPASLDSLQHRQKITLLGHLAEESLAKAGALRAEKSSIFEIKTSAEANPSSPTLPLNGLKIAAGDVLLSKGGAPSSAFISRISDSGGNFSHATLAFLGKNGQLQFPESEIEDGSKIRSPQKDYIDSRKNKLFVYRLNSGPAYSQSAKLPAHATEAIVNEMTERLKAQGKGEENLSTDSSYPYDFSMDASDDSKVFCSEIVMRAYELAGAKSSSTLNPYPQSVWSKISDPSLKDFFSAFLGIKKESFPAPSDMEHNPNFELVGMQIDTAKLKGDRIDLATIDALVWLLKRDPEKTKVYLEYFKGRGNEILDAKKLQPLVDAGLLSAEKVAALSKKIPPNITPKQAVFFAYLNEKLGPEIRKEIMRLKPQSEHVGPVELRSLAAGLVEVRIKKLIGVLETIKL